MAYFTQAVKTCKLKNKSAPSTSENQVTNLAAQIYNYIYLKEMPSFV